MRVLQINSVCGVGSTGRIATDIHQLLIEQGHESYIAYGRGDAINCDQAIRIGSNLDVYYHVMKTRLFDKHGFGSSRASKAFVHKIMSINPDIIHLHNIHGYYINIEVLFDYLKEANKPVIWTLHDCWAFTGHCSHFDFVRCMKWKQGCESCPQIRAYPSSYVKDNSKSNYISKKRIFSGLSDLTIVTPSNWLANLVKESYLNEYPVKVINNGVDLNVFRPTENQFRLKYHLQDKFVILGVANNWGERKGYNSFIELSKMLSDQEVIVMVGLTEDQSNKLPKNIIGITKTNNIHELADIYSSADVFANLTFEDNFPTTNIEALACGTPVLTFQTGGSVESVDTQCGYIVEKGNVEQALSAIIEIKNRGKSSYTNSCIERAHRLYSKKDRFMEYIQLYKTRTKTSLKGTY